MDVIFKRRSIRKYADKKILKEDLKLIIKAGMNAPSARGLRPCSFIAIDDRDILNKIAELNPHAQMLLTASHAIVVCAQELSEFWPQDAAITTENMLLEATSLGLGCCWIGLYPKDVEQDIKKLLDIPNDIRAFSIVSLGYPDEFKEPNDFYEEKRIHYNKW